MRLPTIELEKIYTLIERRFEQWIRKQTILRWSEIFIKAMNTDPAITKIKKTAV